MRRLDCTRSVSVTIDETGRGIEPSPGGEFASVVEDSPLGASWRGTALIY